MFNNFISVKKPSKRIGRGIGSGCGKTSTRGHKGQRARSSNIGPFEGGQIPMYRELPKRGFKRGFININYRKYAVVNLYTLQHLVDNGKISANDTLDLGLCKRLHLVSNNAVLLKILGEGELSVTLSVKVHAISKKARIAIENRGGSVVIMQ